MFTGISPELLRLRNVSGLPRRLKRDGVAKHYKTNDADAPYGLTRAVLRILEHATFADHAMRLGTVVIDSTDGSSYNLAVSGNTLSQCGGNGIYLYNIHNSLFTDNMIDIPTGRIDFDQQGGTSNNLFTDNIINEY